MKKVDCVAKARQRWQFRRKGNGDSDGRRGGIREQLADQSIGNERRTAAAKASQGKDHLNTNE